VESLIAGGWQLVGLTEALNILSEGSARRIVALTFDDALLDFLNAFDVLSRFGARATLYVPTRDVGTRVSRWDKGQSRLSWEHLIEIAEFSIEIGSQSVSGRPLDIGAGVWVKNELRESKRELEDRLATPIESFCYPHGYSTFRVQRMVADVGYSNACVIDSRVASSTDDRFALPRLRIESGITGREILHLVREGEHGIIPQLNRIAAPAWRMTRRSVFWIKRARAMHPHG
jgi:peptidoglycan/xylan/chitin deacetylase (PgdA/CDA1 family)